MRKNGTKAGLTLVMQGFPGERSKRQQKAYYLGIIDYHRKGNETVDAVYVGVQ